ncbi:LuxR C-terminal-related transcriptional regulator [Pseudomonas sp. Pseusp97]|uniref:response regulator transcription factor n=1 Tax=Pseudomonas sp. Pseusp97 TaxID=3243065 RepID=UPI0039A4CB90
MSDHRKPIRVMLIDCRPLVLIGLNDLINARKPRMEVSGQATTYTYALDLADQQRPDVIFFSFFPDALNPLEVVGELTRSAQMKVLVLKGLYEAVPVAQAIEAGARGIVLAEDPTESIIQAIVNVHHRDIGLDRAWAGGLSGYAASGHVPLKCNHEQAKQARLTLRERELISAIVEDPSAKYMSIAERLGISEHTVHNHLSNIYQKLNLINRMDLLMYALKHGLAGSEEPPESAWVELDRTQLPGNGSSLRGS